MNTALWWQQALLVACGGALGSVGRFAVGTWMARVAGTGFPWGTLTVNLAGSLMAGLLFAALDGREHSVWLRALLMVGMLGGFTTWSSFALETIMLGRGEHPAWAPVYVLVSLVAGLVLAWAGWRLGSMLRA